MQVFCHNCVSQFPVSQDWDGACPRCHEGFVEVLEQQAAPPPDHSRQSSFQRSFQLPGGVGTVHVMYGTGPDMAALGGGPFPGFHGGSFTGPAPDPFELIRSIMGGGPFGGQDFMFGSAYDQEQMDRIITQIMNQYQPETRETAQRVRDTLPRLKVRPKSACPHQAGAATSGADSDSEWGMAAVCEGEPCSVCHDEFEAGAEVVELPCTHCFHENCLMPWLEAHNTCPVCRLELPTEQARQQQQPQRQQQEGTAAAHASSSRRRHQQQQQQQQGDGDAAAGGEGGWMGSLNQLLHNIADRWEQTHAESGQADSSSAPAAPPPAGPSVQQQQQQQAPHQSQPSVPPSPRTAAGRAAAARAAGTPGGSADSAQAGGGQGARASGSSGSLNHGRSATPESAGSGPAVAGAAAGGGQGGPPAQGAGDGGNVGLALGGALAALVGSAVQAFMGRNRRPQ